jgi:hypothetical protein
MLELEGDFQEPLEPGADLRLDLWPGEEQQEAAAARADDLPAERPGVPRRIQASCIIVPNSSSESLERRMRWASSTMGP